VDATKKAQVTMKLSNSDNEHSTMVEALWKRVRARRNALSP